MVLSSLGHQSRLAIDLFYNGWVHSDFDLRKAIYKALVAQFGDIIESKHCRNVALVGDIARHEECGHVPYERTQWLPICVNVICDQFGK